MKIVFLTTNDPIYLPSFFNRVFGRYNVRASAVYIVPPLYKNQTTFQAALRYYRTFGFEGLKGLIPRIMWAKLYKQSIASTCSSFDVKYGLVKDVNDERFLAHLRQVDTDLVISVSCPQIFENNLIEMPRFGCLNIHGAILPHYRGVLPSFWMLANGEKKAGVSIYFVNEKIDAGELCGQCIFKILPDESLDGFIRRSKAIAADLLIDILKKIESGDITRTPLALTEGSYYSWPDKDAVRRFRAEGRRLW